MSTDNPPLIGATIKKIRKDQSLTLDTLAERSGVSKAMLSQIESEKVNPTIATVWKIARGLEVELNDIIKGGKERVRKFRSINADETTVLDTAGGPHIEVLSPIEMAEDLEVYLLELSPNSVLTSQPHAPGTEEYLTVLNGTVTVIAGEKSAAVEQGGFVMYNCDITHTIRNDTAAAARVHMVVRFLKKNWV